MISIKVTGIQTDNRKISNEVNKLIDKVSTDVLNVARALTPIKLGRARRGWQKQRSSNGVAVKNTVPYINKLEAGSSKQAPNGILKPTIETISRRKY